MGIVDKLKTVDDWKTVTVVIFFLAVCFGTITLGTVYNIQVLYIGALVALGIPTSLFGNIGSRVFTTTNSGGGGTNKVRVQTIRRLDQIEGNIAEIATQFANLKSQFEMMKINKEINDL